MGLIGQEPSPKEQVSRQGFKLNTGGVISPDMTSPDQNAQIANTDMAQQNQQQGRPTKVIFRDPSFGQPKTAPQGNVKGQGSSSYVRNMRAI